jgi:chromosomal replication initiator protein
MEDAKIAAALRAELEARIGRERYQLWFAAQAQLCIEAGRLTVRAASSFVRDWLRQNFADDLAACVRAIACGPLTVEFDVEASPADCGLPVAKFGSKDPESNRLSAVQNVSAKPAPAPNLCLDTSGQSNSVRGQWPSLSRFVIGASNEYAFRCAELTAHGLQQASPVLFFAETGLGKTHLLRAVQGEYRRRHPRAIAVYLTAEQFTTSFVEALRGSGLPSFRQKCRGAELLLLDDLQFFIGKQRTIEELHHTLDALVVAGRQVVLASDRNIASLRALGSELTSRLSGGLVCEISPPDFATRRAMVQQLAGELGLPLDEDVQSLVAAQITAGPRELRGALYRLQAVSTASHHRITRELAESALGELVRQSIRAVRLSDVEQAVCQMFGVEGSQLRSERKGRTQSEPRMIAMWLARKYTRAPWSEIGHFFGRRSHSTVISAHRRVEKLLTAQAQIGVGHEACNVEEAIRRLERTLRTA